MSEENNSQKENGFLSSNALKIIEHLNSLTKRIIYIDPYELQPDEDWLKEKVLRIIGTSGSDPYITYLKEAHGATFLPLVDATIEFIVYIERDTTKTYYANAFMNQPITKKRDPYGQAVVLDFMKEPLYDGSNKERLEMEYRDKINNHPYKKMCEDYYTKSGTIYLAHFNAPKIIETIYKLCQNNNR